MVKIILQDKWFFSFVIGWLVFILLVDRRTLSRNIWGGFMAVFFEYIEDGLYSAQKLYFFKNAFLPVFGIPVFFTFGVVITMGILYVQFTPKNPDLQMLHLIVFSLVFLVFEYIVTVNDMLVTPFWGIVVSYFDNILVFGSLLWFNSFMLSKVKWRV